jgi:hypothetical protein
MLVPTIALADDSATATAQGSAPGELPKFTASQTVTEEGTVIAVDKKTRDVTIVSEGDTLTVNCGPEVKNFGQIAVGNIVKAKYTETLTIRVEEAGSPGVTAETTTSEAKMGDMPKGVVTDKTEVSATITAINKEAGTVTLKGMQGDEFEITPRVKENLDKVKVGQLVIFTYTEVAAVSVEKVKPEKKAKK